MEMLRKGEVALRRCGRVWSGWGVSEYRKDMRTEREARHRPLVYRVTSSAVLLGIPL